MAFPVSHKTVFVFDHGPNFSGSCHQSMELDIFTKTRQPGIIPLAPLSKTLWTCSVEAAIEYCRIVWDIFPKEKLIRFIISDSSSVTLNTWSQNEQNLNHLMAALAQVGPPQTAVTKDCNVIHGLNAAIESLCECSDIQREKRTSLTENAGKVLNRGRVICFTNVKSELEVKSLLDCFEEALLQHNKLASSSDNLMTIQNCELVLMHVYPVHKESCIVDQPKKIVSPILSTEVHNVKSGRHLAAKLGILVQQHYNLASTTVTGIPMKMAENNDVPQLLKKIQGTYVPFLKKLIASLEKSKKVSPENLEKLRMVYTIFTTAPPSKQVDVFLANKKKLEDWYIKARKKKKFVPSYNKESSQGGIPNEENTSMKEESKKDEDSSQYFRRSRSPINNCPRQSLKSPGYHPSSPLRGHSRAIKHPANYQNYDYGHQPIKNEEFNINLPQQTLLSQQSLNGTWPLHASCFPSVPTSSSSYLLPVPHPPPVPTQPAAFQQRFFPPKFPSYKKIPQWHTPTQYIPPINVPDPKTWDRSYIAYYPDVKNNTPLSVPPPNATVPFYVPSRSMANLLPVVNQNASIGGSINDVTEQFKQSIRHGY